MEILIFSLYIQHPQSGRFTQSEFCYGENWNCNWSMLGWFFLSVERRG